MIGFKISEVITLTILAHQYFDMDLNNITDLLKAIDKRHQMFFSQKLLSHLMRFLDGIYFCKNSNGIYNEDDEKFWEGFNEFVFSKFNQKNKKLLLEQFLISKYNDEKLAYKFFFELFNEFNETKKT